MRRRQVLYTAAGLAAAGAATAGGWLWTESRSSAAGTVLWRAPARPDWGLIAGGGAVYVLGDQLSAVSGRTGKPLWQAGQAAIGGVAGPGVVITAALEPTAISVDATSYTARDARDGRVLWRYNPGGQRKWQARSGGQYPVAVTAGTVLLMPGVATAGRALTALTVSDGRPAWRHALPARPLLTAAAGQQAFLVAADDGTLQAITPATGRVRWQHRLASAPAGLAADPAAGLAYAADQTGVMYAYQA
jgi:outer membrane protein assembly factor BamB